MLALSVSISTSSSPFWTSSPSDFSHLRIVPSSMESDRRGIATSAMPRSVSAAGTSPSQESRTPATHGPVLRRALSGGDQRRRRGRRAVGQREAEGGAAARGRLDPDAPAVALDDLAAHREADAGALVGLARVQALEHLEDPLAVAPVDADPVVGHAHRPAAGTPLGADAPARNFSALATRFWKSCPSAPASPVTTGSWPTSTLAPAASIGPARTRSVRSTASRQSTGRGGPPVRPTRE